MAFGSVNADKIRETNLDAFLMQNGTLATHQNLVCKYVTAATVDIDADAVLLVNATSGDAYKASTVNLTVDITASGANGLDTGSEASSTWYYLWVIYNPDTSTVAGLLSTSSTAPTLPSGYTYKGLVGAVYNNGSSNFFGFRQRDNDVYHYDTASAWNVLSGGTSTVLAAVSLAAFVPTIAKTVDFQVGEVTAGASGQYQLALYSDNATSLAFHFCVAYTASASVQSSNNSARYCKLANVQTVHYSVSSGSNGSITVTGFSY